MNTIKDNYIKREAQYKAAQYLAEKRHQREKRLDLILFVMCFAVIALMPLPLYLG